MAAELITEPLQMMKEKYRIPMGLQSFIDNVLDVFNNPLNVQTAHKNIDPVKLYTYVVRGLHRGHELFMTLMEKGVEKNKLPKRNNIFMCSGQDCNAIFASLESLKDQNLHICELRGVDPKTIASKLSFQRFTYEGIDIDFALRKLPLTLSLTLQTKSKENTGICRMESTSNNMMLFVLLGKVLDKLPIKQTSLTA